MDAEDEEFNRVEMESRIKQEYIRAMKENHEKHVKEHLEFDAHLRIEHLMDDLATARMLIRELGDRLSKLEGKQ
jgi:hypothetical protein